MDSQTRDKRERGWILDLKDNGLGKKATRTRF